MASSSKLDDDDYVAKLLAKDARDSSIKYSAMGLSAYLPKRPTDAAPKPNKRFLNNLLRETDSHNAALKKKEELEARMRLRGERLEPARSGPFQDNRQRKRRRIEEPEDRRRNGHRDHKSQRLHVNSGDQVRERRPHGRSRGDDETDEDEVDYRARQNSRRERAAEHERTRRRGSTSRATSPSKSERSPEDRRRRHRHRRSRSRSISSVERGPKRRGLWQRSQNHKSRSERQLTSPVPGPAKPEKASRRDDTEARSTERGPSSLSDSDSDPLESLVGPLPASTKEIPMNDPPPLRSRGRGAFKPSSSAMDAHFSASYDPSMDLRVESEDEQEKEDWDMALEALRDRELWKKKGAERLREAGFGDEEIKKWEDSGKEKNAKDVKWASRGESREWDRGKVVETDGDRKGEVSLEAAWRRKNGGFLKDLKRALA